MNYREFFTIALSTGLPAQHVDRITVAEYADENGCVVWRDIQGTYTDDKGRRWSCHACNCIAERGTIEAVLKDMRDNQDFEFCVKYELSTIRG
jgi:hypothetical protein